MEAAGWNTRECSVKLWRCDLDAPGCAAWADRSVPAVPHEPAALATPHATDHIKGNHAPNMLCIEVQADHKDPLIKQEPDEGYAHLWQDTMAESDLHVTEAHSTVLEIKDEMDKSTIKQELEIGPTVLQSRIHLSLDMLDNKADRRDVRSGISSDGGATPGPLCATFSRPASQTDVKDDYCQGDSGAPSAASFARVLREQSSDRSSGADMSKCIQKFTDKRYERGFSEYSIRRDTSLVDRVSTHSDGKLYKCKQCKFSASHLGRFRIHMRTHTGKKPYKCKHCEYSASQLCSLKVHTRTHTGEKPFKCEHCEHSASQLGSLKIHMRTHTGEKPFKCEQCEYSASCLGSLKAHTRIHTGEKPYKCDRCEYSASRLHHLKIHTRTHTGEKPYKCDRCEYSASRLHHLKTHMRTHAGEKPYQCD